MENNVSIEFLQRQLQAKITESHLKSGSGDGTSNDMEARVAKLEAAVEHIQRDTTDIKSDLRGMRDLMWSNFKLTFAALIAVAIGLAGLMAKGFHWL